MLKKTPSSGPKAQPWLGSPAESFPFAKPQPALGAQATSPNPFCCGFVLAAAPWLRFPTPFTAATVQGGRGGKRPASRQGATRARYTRESGLGAFGSRRADPVQAAGAPAPHGEVPSGRLAGRSRPATCFHRRWNFLCGLGQGRLFSIFESSRGEAWPRRALGGGKAERGVRGVLRTSSSTSHTITNSLCDGDRTRPTSSPVSV